MNTSRPIESLTDAERGELVIAGIVVKDADGSYRYFWEGKTDAELEDHYRRNETADGGDGRTSRTVGDPAVFDILVAPEHADEAHDARDVARAAFLAALDAAVESYNSGRAGRPVKHHETARAILSAEWNHATGSVDVSRVASLLYGQTARKYWCNAKRAIKALATFVNERPELVKSARSLSR